MDAVIGILGATTHILLSGWWAYLADEEEHPHYRLLNRVLAGIHLVVAGVHTHLALGG